VTVAGRSCAIALNLWPGRGVYLGIRIRPTRVPFKDFVLARGSSLFRTALLLTGQDRSDAEDLLQLALERACRHWPRICRLDEPEGYIRKILANASADRRRRLARRPEQHLNADGVSLVAPDHATWVADRDYLLRALAGLPPRQRAVLVLRYFEDLSEAETAQMLGCSLGTVKSHAAQALARLRRAAAQQSRAAAEGRGEATVVE
jgi:RNA polymerase sigma-70 factor (sigma-E family)